MSESSESPGDGPYDSKGCAAVIWRVFIGLRDDDGEIEYTVVDVSVHHWLDAKMVVLDQLRVFEGDECFTCEADAAEATEALASITYATEWSCEVEGNEYSIMRVLDESKVLR